MDNRFGALSVGVKSGKNISTTMIPRTFSIEYFSELSDYFCGLIEGKVSY